MILCKKASWNGGGNEEEYKAWLRSRPKVVRDLLEEFPPNSVFTIDGVEYFQVGATEDGFLILSTVDPLKDYNRAVSDGPHKKYLCVEHLRNGEAHLEEVT